VVLLALAVAATDVVECGERSVGHIKKFRDAFGKAPALVFFYDPDCTHSRGFMHEFSSAAGNFHEGDISFLQVDVTRWDELKKEYDVARVPDIRFCSSASPSSCQAYPEYSPNTKAGVVEYLEGKIGARFVQGLTEKTTLDLAAIQATKGTCAVRTASSLIETTDSDEDEFEEEGEEEEADEETDEDEGEDEDEEADETEDEDEDEEGDEVEDEADLADEAEDELDNETVDKINDEAEDTEEDADDEEMAAFLEVAHERLDTAFAAFKAENAL